MFRKILLQGMRSASVRSPQVVSRSLECRCIQRSASVRSLQVVSRSLENRCIQRSAFLSRSSLLFNRSPYFPRLIRDFGTTSNKRFVLSSKVYLVDEDGNVKGSIVNILVILSPLQDITNLEAKSVISSEGIEIGSKSLVTVTLFSALYHLGSRFEFIGKVYGPMASRVDVAISRVLFVNLDQKIYGMHDGAERLSKLFGNLVFLGIAYLFGYFGIFKYLKQFTGNFGFEKGITKEEIVKDLLVLQERVLCLEQILQDSDVFTVEQVLLLHQFALTCLEFPSLSFS